MNYSRETISNLYYSKFLQKILQGELDQLNELNIS